MATANDLITRALRLISVIGTGRRSPTANEAADGLVALNAMMESFSLERGLIHYLLEETHTLTTNVGSYTIGSGGDINTTVPVRIENAFIRDSNSYDYPLEIINNLAYDTVTLKTITSRPQYLYFERSYPLGTIYLLYLPNLAETLHINSWKQLQTFSGLTTALSMPIGYEDMIVYNLAVRLHGEYPGSVLSDDARKIAKDTKANLIRINAEPPVLDPGDSIMDLHGHGQRNIFSG
jgi:hypothetical protein